MAPDPRLVQLGRILGIEPAELDGGRAARIIEDHADRLAEAFFLEAVDSDDVTGPDSAAGYLDVRLAFFGEMMSDSAAARIREGFEARVAQWRE